MILDEIEFNNFGVYRGAQRLVFTPPSAEKPIVLIGAMNGSGKTTLLDGLQLALYGKNAHCSNRGEMGYDDFLRISVHRGVDPHEGASVEVAFRHTTEGHENSYRVRRRWSENGKGLKEQLEVHRNGAIDEVLSEQWGEQVETFVPHGISDLFFFDGEKIEQLADINRSSRVLSTAIHSLLGIELVDRLAADLTVLERRKRIVAQSDDTRKRIQEFETDIRQLEELLESLMLERASAQNELDRANKLLREAKDRFRLEGGELFVRREQIMAEKALAESRCAEAKKELRELAAGVAPFLLVQELLASVEKQAAVELEAEESKLLSKLLIARDRSLVEAIKQAGGSTKLVKAVQEFCQEDRNRRMEAHQTPCYLAGDATLREEVSLLTRVSLPDAKKRADYLIQQIENLNELVLKLERQLAAVPDAEALERLRQDVAEAEDAHRKAKLRTDAMDTRLAQLQADRDRRRGDREALLLADIDERVKHLDDVRMLEHSEKVRNTLQKFRVAVVLRHVSRIEYLMLDSFKQLMRKAALISEIKICPETFALELRGADSKRLEPERLSAGERQLLAVSMLWGLARASGRPLPTIIDTPLGRLDSHHRMNLVERYFPFASHQVVLLSTDEEIDERLYPKLKSRIGQQYRLLYRDETQSTTIERGYFWDT